LGVLASTQAWICAAVWGSGARRGGRTRAGSKSQSGAQRHHGGSSSFAAGRAAETAPLSRGSSWHESRSDSRAFQPAFARSILSGVAARHPASGGSVGSDAGVAGGKAWFGEPSPNTRSGLRCCCSACASGPPAGPNPGSASGERTPSAGAAPGRLWYPGFAREGACGRPG
jgi:hypothetical protein